MLDFFLMAKALLLAAALFPIVASPQSETQRAAVQPLP